MVLHDRKDDVMTLTGQEISTLGHFARDHGIFFFGRIDLRPSNPLLAAGRFVYNPFVGLRASTTFWIARRNAIGT